MSPASIKRHAFKTLLVLHFIGLALVVGTRFASFAIEHATGSGSLQFLSQGRDLDGRLGTDCHGTWFLADDKSVASGWWSCATARNVPGWVWGKVGLTVASMVLALTRVAPALEAARKWAHSSAERGQLLPQLHDSLTQVSVYGGIVFALVLLTIPVAVWKPQLTRRSTRGTLS